MRASARPFSGSGLWDRVLHSGARGSSRLRKERQAVDAATTHKLSVEWLLSRGDLDGTIEYLCERGLEPGSATALRLQAIASLRRRDVQRAEALLSGLRLRNGSDALVYKMLGDIRYLQFRFEEAADYYLQAIQIDPHYADAVHDCGVSFLQLGSFERAIDYLSRAAHMAPDRADFEHHLAMIEVLTGSPHGWKRMDARLRVPGLVGNFPHPERYWKGECLRGKRIVVRHEQGFGDTIQFSRYIPALLERGASKVFFFVQRDMFRWAKSKFSHEPRIVCWPSVAPPPLEFDFHVCLMSLPQHFPGQYFTVPKRSSQTEDRRGVGFCWFGSPTHQNDAQRTIPLNQWEPIFNTGIPEPFYCLAYGHFEQKPDFIEYLIADAFDWADTAERVKRLRLVITVDTAIAHLAGDLGVDCWLLLPKIPDFRWGLNGERTHWYESVRLIRASRPLEWSPVIEKVAQDLRRLYGLG